VQKCTHFLRSLPWKKPLPAFKKHIDNLLKSGRKIVIAIDGNCTAGKTAPSAVLKSQYGRKLSCHSPGSLE
jgi:hypothetical protein